MEKSAKQIAELLRVLACESRLLVLCRLMEQPMTVSELVKNVPKITQPALSQHLAVLKAHRILSSSKSGQKITYYIIDDRVGELINVLKEYYCDGGEIYE